MYMFPRQFGLHNVFTSQVDVTKTAQKFHDYTLREEELDPFFSTKSDQEPRLPKLPKRLRGEAERLVERLQTRHGRCSYIELLKHYCPCALDKPTHPRKPKSLKEVISSTMRNMSQINPPGTQQHSRNTPRKQTRKGVPGTQTAKLPEYQALVDLATPASHVSAYCQAVLAKIIPDPFWGIDDVQKHNKATVMRKVDHFIKLRRFETVSLHEMLHKIKVTLLLVEFPKFLCSTDSDIDCRYPLARTAKLEEPKAMQE